MLCVCVRRIQVASHSHANNNLNHKNGNVGLAIDIGPTGRSWSEFAIIILIIKSEWAEGLETATVQSIIILVLGSAGSFLFFFVFRFDAAHGLAAENYVKIYFVAK